MEQNPIKLTDEQIKNWRTALSITLGVYALIMPVSDIEKIANRIQENINKNK